MNKKDRRHSGWITPTATISKKEMIKYNIEIPEMYDDWQNYRDSMRDWIGDYKHIKDTVYNYRTTFSYADKRIVMNNKQKLLLNRRKARKEKVYKWMHL